MTKEQYLSIRTSWKSFIAEGKHKKYKQEYKAGYTRAEDDKWVPVMSHYWISDLKDIHHYIYTLIRKRDPYKAFTGDKIAYLGDNLLTRIRAFERSPTDVNYFNRAIAPLLVPFGEQFKYEDLKSLIL